MAFKQGELTKTIPKYNTNMQDLHVHVLVYDSRTSITWNIIFLNTMTNSFGVNQLKKSVFYTGKNN